MRQYKFTIQRVFWNVLQRRVNKNVIKGVFKNHWLTYSLDERVCRVSPISSKSGTPLPARPREVSSPCSCCSTKSLKVPLRLDLDLEQTWEDYPVCYWRQSDCSTHGSGSGSHPGYQGDVNQRKVGLWLLQQEREQREPGIMMLEWVAGIKHLE